MGVGGLQLAYLRSSLAVRSDVVILPYVVQMCSMRVTGVHVL